MKTRKLIRIAALTALILGGLLLAACIVLPLLLPFLSASSPSLGIIGGADGPTAIVVATGTGIHWDLLIAAALLTVGIVGLIVTRKAS